ncbi:MAG: BamA/TamA family outer membrane protein, partial [Epsilonproteobacteria bacterium]|nr:BamA/TamA family outer membrane protein [Campylobacterota bacterium]
MKRVVFILLLAVSFLCSASIENNSSGEKKKEYILQIEGLNFLDEEDLAKYVGAKNEGIFWKNKFVITEDILDSLESTIKSYLQTKGFFKSKIKIIKEGNIVRVIIDEGEPIRVKDIKIESDFDVNDLIEFKKGDIFSADKFLEIKDNIANRLLESGYCKYDLDTKAYVDIEKLTAKLVYKIKKNKVCYFGKVTIEKYPKDIKKRVILSRLKFRRGDRFSIKKIKDSYLALNKLETFANIKIAYDLENSGYIVDTNVSLEKRKKLKRYLLSIGVDSEIGFRIKGEWEKRNFLGNAQKFKVRAQLSKDYKSFETLFFSPALLSIEKRYLDFYLDSGYSKKETDALEEKKFFINSYLYWEEDNWQIKGGLALERLNIDLYESMPSIIGGNFYLLYPYIDIIYDGRDDKLDPKNGFYFRGYMEYGMSSDEGGVGYIKYLLEARAIKSFGELTLAAVGKVGSIHEVTGNLPASKLFLGGGVFSNRAYGKDKIGVVTSSTSFLPIGGKSMLNLQLEADYKIYKKIYGAIFFDSTMISAEEYTFKGDRIDTLGFGIRYKTPIGPIKVDVGF